MHPEGLESVKKSLFDQVVTVKASSVIPLVTVLVIGETGVYVTIEQSTMFRVN